MSRERPNHGYVRHDYYSPQKPHELLNKSQEYLTKSQESKDYPQKKINYQTNLHEYQSKSQEFLNKPSQDCVPPKSAQEYHGKLPDFPIKPQPFKAQNRDISSIAGRQQSPQVMMSLTSNSTNAAAMRERVASPHRMTSPPVKLQDIPRLQSPPVKMIETRHEYSKLEGSKLDTSTDAPLSPNSSGHFLQQYPERDNSKSQAPVWEAGYLLERYSSGPYSPLPPMHPAAKSEKAIDDQDFMTLDQRTLNVSTTQCINSTGSSLTSSKYQAEKEGEDVLSSQTNSATDKSKISAKLASLGSASDHLENNSHINPEKVQHSHGQRTTLPEHLDNVSQYDIEKTLHSHGQRAAPLNSLSPETTDCGSLSKSSSDGDHNMMNRKRPPTKLKSKRRNILSFPHHLSVDEMRLIKVKIDK